MKEKDNTNKVDANLRRAIDMTIDKITDKIIESKNNDIAKAFTMHIGSLLINNGIVPIMTEYTRNDVKNITDTNEYKLVMEYGIVFKELDCSEHDKEIYNKAIDDFVKAIVDRWLSANDDKYCITHSDNYLKVIKEIAEQLKDGVKWNIKRR